MLISLNMLYTLKTNMKIYSTEIIISEMKIKNNVIIRWNYQDGYTKETKVCMLYVCVPISLVVTAVKLRQDIH